MKSHQNNHMVKSNKIEDKYRYSNDRSELEFWPDWNGREMKCFETFRSEQSEFKLYTNVSKIKLTLWTPEFTVDPQCPVWRSGWNGEWELAGREGERGELEPD